MMVSDERSVSRTDPFLELWSSFSDVLLSCISNSRPSVRHKAVNKTITHEGECGVSGVSLLGTSSIERGEGGQGSLRGAAV